MYLYLLAQADFIYSYMNFYSFITIINTNQVNIYEKILITCLSGKHAGIGMRAKIRLIGHFALQYDRSMLKK
jgi:hypothetical protein